MAMTDVIKLIHPKIGTVREIAVTNENKFMILKRAGFILFKDYKPPKVKEEVPEPTLAEIVAKEGEKVEIGGKKVAAEVAVHEEVKLPRDEILISKAAAEMIETFEIDLGMLEGTGKDGKITKTDVNKFLDDQMDQKAPDEELESDEGNLAEDHEGDGLGDAGATEGEDPAPESDENTEGE
jgi:pyruvate/2-oxoglutarate dehydrogenase complex dihydrolipoamide acyltransferase (E2) component